MRVTGGDMGTCSSKYRPAGNKTQPAARLSGIDHHMEKRGPPSIIVANHCFEYLARRKCFLWLQVSQGLVSRPAVLLLRACGTAVRRGRSTPQRKRRLFHGEQKQRNEGEGPNSSISFKGTPPMCRPCPLGSSASWWHYRGGPKPFTCGTRQHPRFELQQKVSMELEPHITGCFQTTGSAA